MLINKLFSLPKLASLGLATISAISASSLIIAPSQAAPFTQDSIFEWDNGTTNFNEELTTILDNGSGSFDVTFSPLSLGGAAASFIATGDFASSFTSIPGLYDVTGANATFNFVSATSDPDAVQAGIFELIGSGLTFTFPETGVTATLASGAQFLGVELANGAVEVELEDGQWFFSGLVDDIEGPAFDSVLVFGDLVGPDGGTYAAQGEVEEGAGLTSVPEPTSMLGLIAVGSLGLGLKRKK